MIANPTTLILGAGASHECGYPTGAGLKQKIIERCLATNPRHRLGLSLQWSLIPSIDAFLAEDENKAFREDGQFMIAEALLPREAEGDDGAAPPWVCDVFNAIRGRASDERKHKLKVVTFNYDLSLEYYLHRAFRTSYLLTYEQALAQLNESVEFIHVYGQLGKINFGFSEGRAYGEEATWDEKKGAANAIRIIGRDPKAGEFPRAQAAINEANFIAILGFGYDATNMANLLLRETAGGKNAFGTGYHVGYGMRGWIKQQGLGPMLMGSYREKVSGFLSKSGFLNWANTPGASSEQLMQSLRHLTGFEHREYHVW